MGMDPIEIVLRAERVFGISISDLEVAQVRTVGQFYELICTKLAVEPLPAPATPSELPRLTEKVRRFLILESHTHLPTPAELLPWSAQTVWNALVAIFVDQQGLQANKIVLSARITKDLGIS